MSCACSRDFIVESCDLASGRVRAVLNPISMDWQTDLNGWGQGTLTLATKDVKIRDIWPDLTSVYISRTAGGGGASPSNPVAEFGGMITQVNATEAGTTQVGLESIESYLNRRTLKRTLSYTERPQTRIAMRLVEEAQFNGIPLFADAAESQFDRDRTYQPWNRKLIGEAVQELTQIINGPDWEIVHSRLDGHWSTTMFFRDFVGVDRSEEVQLQSDRELSAYALTIDAKDHATWVDAIGSGEEEDQLLVTAVDPANIYPQFDAAPAWKDVNRLTTLQQHADGYLEEYREPRAAPTFSIAGLSPSPSLLRLGDIVDVRQDFGAVTFHGHARIITISWALGVDEPITRTFETVPMIRASESVLQQTPRDDCGGNC